VTGCPVRSGRCDYLPAVLVHFGATALGRFLVLRPAGITLWQSLRIDASTWQRLSRAQRIATWAVPHLLALLAGFVVLVACGLGMPATANDGTVDPMPGRPAEQAGVLAGDRVVSVNGAPINVFTDISARVRAAPTDDIDLDLDRGGKALQVRVRRTDGIIGVRPSNRAATLTDAVGFATTFPVATARAWASAITRDPDVRVGAPVDASRAIASGGATTLLTLIAYHILMLFVAVPILCAIGTPWWRVFSRRRG
jgi:membrane-associated protease RseP (regulator of RpoE activity)